MALAAIDIAGYEGLSPFPWGRVAAVTTIAMVQLTVGLVINRRDDPTATDALWPMPWYPGFIVGCTTLASTIPTLRRPRSGPNVTWNVDRSNE